MKKKTKNCEYFSQINDKKTQKPLREDYALENDVLFRKLGKLSRDKNDFSNKSFWFL